MTPDNGDEPSQSANERDTETQQTATETEADESEADGLYAPAAERMLEDCLAAIDEGDIGRAQKRAGQAHDALVHRESESYQPSGAAKEALEEAVKADDFYDNLTIGPRQLDDEWTVDGFDLAEIPPKLARELRSINGLFRITIEPETADGTSWSLRFENLNQFYENERDN